MAIFRIYVEKKDEFAIDAATLNWNIKNLLEIKNLKKTRIINRYDIEGIDEETFLKSIPTIFSQHLLDNIFFNLPELENVIPIELQPGQFNQRANYCEQAIQLLTFAEKPIVRTAQIFSFEGNLTELDLTKIKKYLINPIECRQADLKKPSTLNISIPAPSNVEVLSDFNELTEQELLNFIETKSLTLSLQDIKLCQDYFKNIEKRNPTITEIRVLDTFWCDHCRHSTFNTVITDFEILDPEIKETFNEFLKINENLNSEKKPVTLMNIATIAAKKLKQEGLLNELDSSDEINACSVNIKIKTENEIQNALLMFKNETHNHPTEIEPFGGASTCLGGAIRDPLSGRAFVFQGMRITGAANPLEPINSTLKGKLPQQKIVTEAANGFSAYGNEIGIPTGFVEEIYHPGYVAKRLELGAVIGVALKENVVRKKPEPGDVVVLLGGLTGKDGCFGAAGSSKKHTVSSSTNCGAEVQKGNSPEERKIMRLFLNEKISRLIKKCNDFGAGGVAVALGELADGLEIDLSSIPVKHAGLDGTELAISESQERMAVVIASENLNEFIKAASEENLNATKIATVTSKNYLTMQWNNETIVKLSREFLNSNGAEKFAKVKIFNETITPIFNRVNTAKSWLEHLNSLNICSQKGLIERFDSTVGAKTVLLPFGGKFQTTKAQSMAALIPIKGNVETVSVMAYGFNPHLTSQSPFYGAQFAIIESVAKIIAAGGKLKNCWLTFQEFFPKLQTEPERWGLPFSALLGALKAQLNLKVAAIGGKDSMSGSFENLDVPPTLVSFAVSTTKISDVISPEFKKAGNKVAILIPEQTNLKTPNYSSIIKTLQTLENLISKKIVISAWALSYGGVSQAISNMCFGNKLGFKFKKELSNEILFNPVYGGFIVELEKEAPDLEILGEVIENYEIELTNFKISVTELEAAFNEKLEPIFKTKLQTTSNQPIETINFFNNNPKKFNGLTKIPKPTVLIPVFPGTSCELDLAESFNLAGANCEFSICKNLTSNDVIQSAKEFANKILSCNIIAIPGGFSGADEPDGASKFMAAFFRNPFVLEQVNNFLKNKDGLMIGICNGFQALLKLGLIEYGEIVSPTKIQSALTTNLIGRHQSKIVRTRVASNKSPWFNNSKVGDVQNVAISHTQGCFTASLNVINSLIKNGQIATQYVDFNEQASLNIEFNPNGSCYAIEGLTSPDGRILGKMGHNERMLPKLYVNMPIFNPHPIFIAGVDYFN